MGFLSDIPERLWLILLGLSVFLITSFLMTADFHSIDEVAMFVTAINVADSGEFHANQIGYSLWGIRPGEEVTTLGNNGDIFTKKSPLMIFLMAPLVLLGRTLPFLTISRAVLWLGPLLTTIIALILYRVGRELAYGRLVSTIAVLMLVAGTMILPYAQTVFGEIVATLGLLLAVWALLRLIRGGDHWAAAGVGVGVGLACGVNSIYFALAGIVALLILLWLRPANSWPTVFQRLFFFAFPVAAVVTILLVYNYLRFGSIWETGYQFGEGGEGFRTPLWWGTLGLTISPARGLLWYSPPVILALFSWPLFHRQQPRISWAITIILLFHVVVFSLWWEWWGGYGWGPRFLLPIVPLLLIVTLPGLARAVSGSWPWRLAILVLLIAGITVQIAGVTINPNLYELELDAKHPAPVDQPLRYHHDPSLVYDAAASPIVQHWRQIGSGTGPWQLGWWRENGQDQSTIVEEIRTRQRTGDVVALLDFTLQNQFLEASDLPPVFGLPVNVAEDDSRAQTLWERVQRDAKRIWLVTWYPPADAGNWYERQIRQTWASEDEGWHDERRVVLTTRPLAAADGTEVDISFGPLKLISYHLATQGDQMVIELTWTALTSVDSDYINFVHLTDQDGQILSQQDRQPLGGYYPTSHWRPGETVTDRLAFILPEGVESGDVMLRVGWYSWPSLERLPVLSDMFEIVDNSLVIEAVNDGQK